MSERRSDSELEDVLSSIRRLVSASLGQSPQPAKDGDSSAAESEAKDSARRAADELAKTQVEQADEAQVPSVAEQEAENDQTAPQEPPSTMLVLSQSFRLRDEEDEEEASSVQTAAAEPLADDRSGAGAEDAETEDVADPMQSMPDPVEALEWAAPGVEEDDLDDEDENEEQVRQSAPVVSIRTGQQGPYAGEEEQRAETHQPLATQDDLQSDQAIARIDEDHLQELVSQIIRDELRGALGERITRNVRQLVRREIQRSLALKDLEQDD